MPLQSLVQQPTDLARIEVIDERIAEILRTKTPGERLAKCFATRAFARMIVESGVRHTNPAWDTARVNQEVIRRMQLGSAGWPFGHNSGQQIYLCEGLASSQAHSRC